ncbi:hypothetical protein ACSQ67_011326 [Phaseolus vulgaris]
MPRSFPLSTGTLIFSHRFHKPMLLLANSQLTQQIHIVLRRLACVLNRVKRTGEKRAEFWPNVPQHVVTYPHASGVYDKRSPSGYVRNMQSFTPSLRRRETCNHVPFR